MFVLIFSCEMQLGELARKSGDCLMINFVF